MRPLSRLGLLAAAGMVVAACASSMTLTEYATNVERLVATMNERLDSFDAELASDPTLALARAAAEDRVDARYEFVERFADLDPPDSAADLHAAALDIMTRLADAEAVLAEMVAAAGSLEEVDEIWLTPEGLAARAIDEEALEICAAAQAGMDATAGNREFEGLPWIPPEMREVVQVTFRCVRDDG